MSSEEYSQRFIEMATDTSRYGVLERPDGYGKKTGECGDTVELYLSVRGGQVRMLTFQINGCINTYACASAISHLVEGRMVGDCWDLAPEHVASRLESLPPDHFHCAELAVGAFYLALSDYHRNCREPWRKDYPARPIG